MSAALMGAAFFADVPTAQRLLLLSLADHANDDGESVWPGNERLAAKTGQSVRNVRRLLRLLEERGLIARVAHAAGGRGHAVEYVLNAERIYGAAFAAGWARGGRPGRQSPFPPASEHTPVKEDTDVPVSGTERRTPSVLKEDTTGLKEDTGVPPTIREPSREPSEDPPLPPPPVQAAAVDRSDEVDPTPATTRRRDLLFEAVAAVCFGADNYQTLTSRERGMANRACGELRAVGATPGDIAERAAHFVAWVGQRPTPDNLLVHWNRLREPVQRLSQADLDAVADTQRMRRLVADAEAAERAQAPAPPPPPDLELGAGDAPLTSTEHPREPGEPVRDYIRRLNTLRREVG